MTVQLIRVVVPVMYMAPPPPAEFPLIVQLVSVAVPPLNTPPPVVLTTELPLTLLLLNVSVPLLYRPPPNWNATLPLNVHPVTTLVPA